MDPLLFANTSNQILSEELDGGPVILPDLVAGGSLHLGLRLAARRGGLNFAKDRDVVDAFAAVGSLDVRPSAGSVRLWIGEDPAVEGGNLTAQFSAAVTAAEMAAAINALALVTGETLPACEVTEDNGSFLVVFPDWPEAVPITAAENELEPISLVRVVAYQVGNQWVQAVRFIVAPAAFAPEAVRRVPPPPSFLRLRAGDSTEGQEQNELQALLMPPEFAGVYEIGRGYQFSATLDREDGPAAIADAMASLADNGGIFLVSNPTSGEAWVEFAGEMAATPQELLTVRVPRAPAGDLWFKLDFDGPEFFALLREADLVSVPLHVRVLYRDEVDADVIHTADWIVDATARRGLHWSGLVASARTDFLLPSANTYVPGSGAVITGNQHYVAVFPEDLDVGASSFVHTHDLGSESGHFSLRRNLTPGAHLVEGRDYGITFENADQFTVELLPGGYFADPVVNVGDPSLLNLSGGGTIAALGALEITFTTAGPQSALLEHTQPIASVEGLVDVLSDVSGRLGALEVAVPAGNARLELAAAAGIVARWDLDPVRMVVPLSRTATPASMAAWPARVSGLLSLVKPSAPGVPPGTPLLRARSGSLLPAVHDAAPESWTASGFDVETIPADDLSSRVFENDTEADIFLAGAGGRGSVLVAPGEFLACNGVVWYAVENQATGDAETSYYPVQFTRDLFAFPVSSDQLAVKRRFQVFFALDAALLLANCRASVVLEVAFGQSVAADAPADPGQNLESVTWAAPCLVQQIHLSGQAAVHDFGLRVMRSGAGVLSAEVIRYGTAAAVEAPAAASFWIRGRLRKFDIEDGEPDPRGFLAVAGLGLPSGAAAALDASVFGFATVSI